MSEAHCNKLPQRKALGLVTHDNTGGPFVVECHGCGEVYPSFHCLGGGQIADTGDYEDARCPHCDQVDPHECDNAALAWNTQQLKINELQQRLNAADQRNDELVRGRGEPVMKLEAERLWGGAGEYAVSFVKAGWLDECRRTGGVFQLYTAPPAPAVVMLPERKSQGTHNSHDWDEGHADGWAAYDAELKRLNPSL